MMNYKWKSKPMKEIAKYAKHQVEKNEKWAKEFREKVKHNPTHAIGKSFAIHPVHMQPIFKPKLAK